MKKKLKSEVVLLAAAFTAAVPLLFSGVEPWQILKFAGWIVWFNLLPGLGLLRFTGKRSGLSLALAIGAALNTLVYLLGLGIGFYWGYILVMSGLGLMGLRDGVVYLKTGRNCLRLIDAVLLILFTGLLNTMLYYNYYLACPLPGGEPVHYYLDIPWHLGNIASLSTTWFPQDFRLAGFPFKYHFFAYAWMASLKKTAQVSSSLVLMRFFPAFFMNLILLEILSLNHTARSKNKGNSFPKITDGSIPTRSAIAFLTIILMLWAGSLVPFKPYNLFVNNLMWSPTYLLALALALPLVFEIVRVLDQQSSSTGEYLVIVLLMMAVSGAKGTFLPVIIAGVLFAAVAARSFSLQAITILLAGIVVFVVSYLLLYRGGGVSALQFSGFRLVYNTEIYQQIIAWLSSRGLENPGPLAIGLYFLAYLGVRVSGLFYGIARTLRRDSAASFLLGAALAGMAGGYLLEARDNSQYYFLFAGITGLNLLTANYLARIWEQSIARVKPRLSSNTRNKENAFRPGALFTITLISCLLLISGLDTLKMVKKNLADARQRDSLTVKSLTSGLYEGLLFLRDKTPPGSLAAGRRFSGTAGRRVWFYYSGFGERPLLLEGWEFLPPSRISQVERRYQDMAELYRTVSPARAKKIIQRYGIDYLIADKKYRSTVPRFNRKGIMSPVFENTEVIIYRIKINSR